MNAVGLIFVILSMLSIGAFLSLERQVGALKLRSHYSGRFYTNRSLLNQMESRLYQSLKKEKAQQTTPFVQEQKNEALQSSALPPAKQEIAAAQKSEILDVKNLQAQETLKPKAQEHKNKAVEKIKKSTKKEKARLIVNPECARLNLYPLLQDKNNAKNSLLYETAAQALKTWYGEMLFDNKPGAEYRFLDAFLKTVARSPRMALEKLEFDIPAMQHAYYRMLKGQKPDLLPSLLDLIQLSPTPQAICIHHAHPQMLAALFSPKISSLLYQQIHQDEEAPITQEMIQRICLQEHHLVNDRIFDLVSLGRAKHKETQSSTLIIKDADTPVCVRKTIAIQ